jgi:hypothetical protein
MPNVAITLSEEDQIRLEEILMDKDGQAALEFLRQVIGRKLEKHAKGHCKPPV